MMMSQPALSQQVAALELETGQRLLNRNGRGAEPTDSGLALLAHARGIFELAERARADMRERLLTPSGRITGMIGTGLLVLGIIGILAVFGLAAASVDNSDLSYDPDTGQLSETGNVTEVGAPVCILFG